MCKIYEINTHIYLREDIFINNNQNQNIIYANFHKHLIMKIYHRFYQE